MSLRKSMANMVSIMMLISLPFGLLNAECQCKSKGVNPANLQEVGEIRSASDDIDDIDDIDDDIDDINMSS